MKEKELYEKGEKVFFKVVYCNWFKDGSDAIFYFPAVVKRGNNKWKPSVLVEFYDCGEYRTAEINIQDLRKALTETENELPIEKKEDFIGRFWKCPRCKADVMISENGIDHHCRGFWIVRDLDEFMEYHKLGLEMEYKLLYGDEKESDPV